MNDYRPKVQVKPGHYDGLHYDGKKRWISYWHQFNEIIKLEPNNVLEIGIGNSTVSNYLRNRGLDVTTLDIDQRLNPDKLGSVLDIPFDSNSFDIAACFEVLEHIPYENFSKALKELKRVTKNNILISLPDKSRAYRFKIDIPKIGTFQKLITIPRFNLPIHEFDGEHYWEIGKKDYALEKIKSDIEKNDLKILDSFRVFEQPYHRFFILGK